jgi:2-hydroxycyclohexanecarboxyl-CoA dehydrogenase
MAAVEKTIILTGGASGIGKATALLLAGEGARVVVGDIDEAGGSALCAAAAESRLDIRYEKLNLIDPTSVDAFANAAIEIGGGRIHGLVNAAGWDKVEPFLQNTPELWDRVMAINLMGAVRLTHTIVARMVEANVGKIVNVSSDAGRVGSMGETVYAAAKGGMIAFTKSLARETARYKLNINCVCPGPTDTPLFHAQPDQRIKDALVRAIPFRRLAAPEEVGNAIAFFLSEKASYVTGQVLSVSGGLTMVG